MKIDNPTGPKNHGTVKEGGVTKAFGKDGSNWSGSATDERGKTPKDTGLSRSIGSGSVPKFGG